MADEKDTKHHVAWADRLGLNKQWSRDIHNCSETFGTDYYINNVNRFRSNIPNIKKGPQLKDRINEYRIKLQEWINTSHIIWKENNPQDARNRAESDNQYNRLQQQAYINLYQFIIQLLEDHGFCFYESSIEEDEIEQ